jgi:hypothetical protein
MSKVALFSWDFNGTIEYVNQCLSDLLFFSQEELVTRSIFELIHTEDLIRFEVEFEKIVNGSTDSSHVNLRYLVGEGRFSWFQHLMIVSREEKKIYAFIFSLPGKLFSHETFLLEKIDLEHVILGELKRRRKDERTEFVFKNNSQSTYIVECSSKVALQSLLRAVVYQYHSLESSHPHCKIEVSLVERDKVISVNFSGDCVLRPKKSFFLGIYKIAKILDIKMEELVVGELYFIRFDLKKS